MASTSSEEKLLKLFRKSLKEFRRVEMWDPYKFSFRIDHFKQTITSYMKEPNPLRVSTFIEENDNYLTKHSKKYPYATYRYDYKGEEYYDYLEQHRKYFGFDVTEPLKAILETNRFTPKPPMAKFYRRCGFKYSNKLGYIR